MNICDEMRAFYLDLFQKDPQRILPILCSLSVPRKLFLEKYKKLTPIEAFPNEEKLEWKKFVNEVFPRTSPTFRLEAVKIIYCVGVLTN